MMAFGVVWAGAKGGEWMIVELPVSRGQQMRELQEHTAARMQPGGMARKAMIGWSGVAGLERRDERGRAGV